MPLIQKPLSEEDLDATLAQEKAIDEAMLEGDDGVIAEFGDIDQKSVSMIPVASSAFCKLGRSVPNSLASCMQEVLDKQIF